MGRPRRVPRRPALVEGHPARRHGSRACSCVASGRGDAGARQRDSRRHLRWLGPERVERFLSELYADAKAIAPGTLFTYVNYPPTEYLNLPFIDLVAFNVYLHRERDLRAYLARLQNLAGHKPLLVAEAGADSVREGVSQQAALTAMQLRASFAEGACGAVAFAWTDEWWRGGQAINDWAFGLVDAERRPKPALQSVAEVFRACPLRRGRGRA